MLTMRSMWKQDVIEHYGSIVAAARALGIQGHAVSMWGPLVPKLRAYQLEVLTRGVLTVDAGLYQLPAADLPAAFAASRAA